MNRPRLCGQHKKPRVQEDSVLGGGRRVSGASPVFS